MKAIVEKWNSISLVKRILCGLVIGAILGFVAKEATVIGLLGELFVGALKAVAPILVFFLVMGALAQHKDGQKSNMGTVIGLYLIATFSAGLVAVIASFIFPVTVNLGAAAAADGASAPGGIGEVLKTLLLNVVSNPVGSIVDANYIGILAWAVVFGLALRKSSDKTKALLSDISDAVTQAVRWVISFAPLGCMVFVALVINPLIVFLNIKQNPYPLVFKCLKDSGITAFCTRSSAANIPVNMELCKNLGLNEDNYSVSIPLGATINMGGAAVTISVLSLAAVHTLGIKVDIPTALILSLLSAVSACGASGVAGGSLLLIPLACSLFGISNDIAMQMVGVGFIIGVIQDSCETGLNSSTDALLTATAEFKQWKKEGKTILLASHNEDDIRILCDRVYEMDGGILRERTMEKDEK